MNRRELVSELAERSGVDRRTVDGLLGDVVAVVTEQVAGGDPVMITGFVKFTRVDVAAKPRRQVRNPATGETMWAEKKPASKKVRVTVLKNFKDAVLTAKPKRSRAAAR